MSEINQYGLNRHIKEDIKRIIRQNSGFGCVVCGGLTIDYEHVDPEFKDAREHDPSKMTLLCSVCHAKVTRGRMSKEYVKKAMLNPKAKQADYLNDWFDISSDSLIFQFGKLKFYGCIVPIRIDGIDILTVSEPEEVNGPLRLSGVFFDQVGKLALVIKNNEYRLYNKFWDISFVGTTLFIRNSLIIILELKVIPPDIIHVKRANMDLFGTILKVNKKVFEVKAPKRTISFKGDFTFMYYGVALDFSTKYPYINL